MASQNMGNIVSDSAPAQDQAIMLNDIDILSMAHCKQIQWHLNETTTALIKENSKYCLQGVGHFIWVSMPCYRKGSRVTFRQIREFDVRDIHEALLLRKLKVLFARCWPFYLGLNALLSERVESNV